MHSRHTGHGAQCACGGHGGGHHPQCACGGHGGGHHTQRSYGRHIGYHIPRGSHGQIRRRYLTRDERIAWLESYLEALEAETQAVGERIAELRAIETEAEEPQAETQG